MWILIPHVAQNTCGIRGSLLERMFGRSQMLRQPKLCTDLLFANNAHKPPNQGTQSCARCHEQRQRYRVRIQSGSRPASQKQKAAGTNHAGNAVRGGKAGQLQDSLPCFLACLTNADVKTNHDADGQNPNGHHRDSQPRVRRCAA